MKSKTKQSKTKTEKRMLEKPKVSITPNLDSLKAIRRLGSQRIALVNQQNPNMINGFFRDSWILEQRKIKSWLHTDERFENE